MTNIAFMVSAGPLAGKIFLASLEEVERAEANGWGMRIKGAKSKLPRPDQQAENADAVEWAKGRYANRQMTSSPESARPTAPAPSPPPPSPPPPTPPPPPPAEQAAAPKSRIRPKAKAKG